MSFAKATVVLILFAFIFTSCKKKEEPPAVQLPQFEIQKRDNMPVFDSLNVYDYVKKQTEFGPRVSGLNSWENAKKYLIERLQKSGAKVTLQDFEAVVPWGDKMKFTNIIGSFNPDAAKRVLLCAHWDSRPHADKEADSSKHKTPIPGANDGASGTGVLLELANVIGKNKLDYGVDIVLFDGEDYGLSSSLEGYCLGSKHFATNYPLSIKPIFGILLDLVGDMEAVYMREPASMQYAGDVVDLLWQYAQSSGNTRFKDFISQPIYDDHIPLNEAGIKTLNIIDAGLVGANSANPRRNYWHTLNDDMRNISMTTLYDLGRVLTGFLYSLKIN